MQHEFPRINISSYRPAVRNTTQHSRGHPNPSPGRGSQELAPVFPPEVNSDITPAQKPSPTWLGLAEWIALSARLCYRFCPLSPHLAGPEAGRGWGQLAVCSVCQTAFRICGLSALTPTLSDSRKDHHKEGCDSSWFAVLGQYYSPTASLMLAHFWAGDFHQFSEGL